MSEPGVDLDSLSPLSPTSSQLADTPNFIP